MKCEWYPTTFPGISVKGWVTSCFEVRTDDPHGMKYCPYCKRVIEIKTEEEAWHHEREWNEKYIKYLKHTNRMKEELALKKYMKGNMK